MRCIIIYLFAFTVVGFSQELPPIIKYTPQTYLGETQNWMLSQSDEGCIYAANNDGLLEYNGAKWTLYQTPNKSIMRSVKVIGRRIYTGFYMGFGYWEKDEFGVLRFESLSNKITSELSENQQFWDILEIGDWIAFQSFSQIILYNRKENTFRFVKHEGIEISKIQSVNNTLYYILTNKNIYKIEDGNSVFIAKLPVDENNKIIGLSPSNNGLLAITQYNGFYHISEFGIVTKIITPIDNYLKKNSIFNSLVLKDGRIALGTISNGLIILNKNFEIEIKIDQQYGLNNNTVLALYQDYDDNLWLGLDNGINFINLTSPFRFYYDDTGFLGTVYASAIYHGDIYVGTNQGLYYKPKGETKYRFIKGTNGQVWNLFVYDDTLFCAHHLGTFIVNKEAALLITQNLRTWDIKPVPGKPNVLLSGNYTGLSLLEKKNNRWVSTSKINGLTYPPVFLRLTGNGKSG